MIPILYESTETAFTTNGLGRLADAVECNVTEERNGSYELFMRYPTSGAHYADIALERLIYAAHDETKVPQAFRIYKMTKPFNGVVSIYAEHISYQLGRVIVAPFTASSCAGALAGLESNAIGAMGFTFWTDKSVVSDFSVDAPQSIRGLLAGQSGSILDVYGGEFEFDMRTVKLYTNRGSDLGVTLRYGKNITDITADADMTNVYTAIVPYWTNGEKTVMLPEKILYADTQYTDTLAKAVDFSSDFEEEPSASALRSRAQSYLKNNHGWAIKQNVKVDFVQLWQTKEYENYAPLQRVRLCDTVTVIYEPLEVSTTAEVVKTVYNVLLDRYDEIEVGEASSSISEAIADVTNEATKDLPTKNFLQQSIERATAAITGGLGGHVKFIYNADGEMEEIVIMDTDDIETAVNVWRWNQNGLGYSSTGYNGEYRLAITADGHIVADFIDTGYLSANRIRAGIMNALSGFVSLDLDSGVLAVRQINLLTDADQSRYICSLFGGGFGLRFYQDSDPSDVYSAFMSIGVQAEKPSATVGIYGCGDASTLGKSAHVSVNRNDANIIAGNLEMNISNELDFRAAKFSVTDGNGNEGEAKSCHLWVTNSDGGQGRLDFVNGILTSFYNITDD